MATRNSTVSTDRTTLTFTTVLGDHAARWTVQMPAGYGIDLRNPGLSLHNLTQMGRGAVREWIRSFPVDPDVVQNLTMDEDPV